MELFEAIEKRHSYRGVFTDAQVPRGDLERIVRAGMQAPSGCNAQTTSFVIVDDPGLLSEIGAVIDSPVIDSAKAAVVCVMETRAVYEAMSFGVEDCAAAVENMLLAVCGLGYATVWMDGVLRRAGRAEKIAALLGIPDGLEVRVILPVGVPAEEWGQKEKKTFEDRAWFNSYGKVAGKASNDASSDPC